MAGALKVRAAERADTSRIVSFVAGVLRETSAQKAPFYDDAFYRWQYDPERDVVLIADDGEQVLAHYPLVANSMSWNGRPLLAGVCQDLCVDPSLRRQGVFREMGEQATQRAREKGIEILFAFPNVRSIGGFLRHHGYRLVGEYAWRVAVIDPLRLGALTRMVWQHGPDAGLMTSPPWPLLDQVLPPRSLLTTRSDRWVNWRFGARPHTAYVGLVSEGAWLALRVVEIKGLRVGLVMDVQTTGTNQLRRLLMSARRYFREQRAAVALLAATPSIASARGFLGAGFFPLPRRLAPRRLFLVARSLVPELEPLTNDLGAWSLTLADWDVF